MSSNVRFELKAATETAHERLDATMATLDLSSASGLASFLKIHSAVLPALENALADAGLEDIAPGWAGGRRSHALRADLDCLGTQPARPVPLPPLDDEASMLGAAYVLEGSRLGGRMLERLVGNDLPNAFFEAGCNIAPWTALIAALERLIYTPERLNQAKAAATGIFAAYFEAAGESGLPL